MSIDKSKTMAASLNNFNVPARLYYWAQKRPNSEAFVYLGKDGSRSVLTCKEIFEKAVHFAKQLQKLGLTRGDVVCSLLPDSTPNGFIAFFGIILAGCVVLNGKLQLKDGSFLIHNLNKTKCKVLIVSSDKDEPCHKLLSGLLEYKDGHAVSSDILVHVNQVVLAKDDPEVGFQWMLPASQSYQIEDCVEDLLDCDGNADAIILLSSGTTGMSKMIVHSHLIFFNIAEPYYNNSKSGAICYYPLNWAPGLPSYYILTGFKTVYPDGRSLTDADGVPDFTLNLVLKEKCDVFIASSEDLIAVTSAVKDNIVPENWPEICPMAGRPISESIIDIMKRFFKEMYNMYGSSECGLISNKKINVNIQYEDFNTGTPMVNSRVIIRNENNEVVPQGKTGNVYVKTKCMFNRYFGDEKLTKSAIDGEGFINMTDLGYFNNQGELIIFGRRKDVIERSEDYFHPVWIEKVIKTCPEVKDVIVVKVPDEVKGNEICACVVLVSGSHFTTEKIEDFCRNTFVEEDYEHVTACPNYYILLEKIPLNRNYKPDRLVVERYAAKVLNL